MSLLLQKMRARDPHQEHRVSTQLELLFDLVIVIGIAALTAAFHHAISAGHGVEMLPNFVFMFMALWWAWMNFTWFASAFDNDDALYRLLVLVIMTGTLIFASGIAHIFETMDFSLGLVGWIIMRVGMVALWLRAAAHNPDMRKTCLRYALGLIVAQVFWTLLGLQGMPGTTGFMLIGAAIFAFEFSVPVWAEKAAGSPYNRYHIVERYGLLTIIVLGEVLLAISQTFGSQYSGTLDFGLFKIGLSAMVIVFAYWWIYFAEEQHLVKSDFRRSFVWGYGHFFVFAAVSLTGAGLAAHLDVQTHHSETTPVIVGWFVGGPLAVALLALWVVRDRYMPLGARRWALPVGATAILAATAFTTEPMIFAAVMIATLLWRAPMTHSKDITREH